MSVPEQWWEAACKKVRHPIACVGLDDHFIFVNQEWCRLTGYSLFDLKEMTWQEITHPDDIGGDYLSEKQIKEGEADDYYLEKRYIRKDGHEIPVGLYVHRYPESGELECFIVSAVTKATNKVKVEQLRKEISKELSEVSAMITELSSRNAWKSFIEWCLKYWPIITCVAAFIAWMINLAISLRK